MATDACGNSVSYDQTITVEDQTFLDSLTLSHGMLQPEFQWDGTRYYRVYVDFEVENITVTPIAAHADLIIKVNGEVVQSGSPSSLVPLEAGWNTLDIQVATRDETSSRTYIIYVLRDAGADTSQSEAEFYDYLFNLFSHVQLDGQLRNLVANDNFLIAHTEINRGSHIITVFSEPSGTLLWEKNFQSINNQIPYLFEDKLALVGVEGSDSRSMVSFYVFDANTGDVLTQIPGVGLWGHYGKCIVSGSGSTGEIFDLQESRKIYSYSSTNVIRLGALIGDKVLYSAGPGTEGRKPYPLLFSLSEQRELWSGTDFPDDQKNFLHNQVKSVYNIKRDGFPVLFISRHLSIGEELQFYFLKENGEGHFISPQFFGLTEPHYSGAKIDFAFTRNTDQGPILITGINTGHLGNIDTYKEIIVTLDNQGNELGRIEFSLKDNKIYFSGLDSSGNLILLLYRYRPNRGYFMVSYSVPNLEENYEKNFSYLRASPHGVHLVDNEIFIWGTTSRKGHTILSLEPAADATISAYYPFEENSAKLVVWSGHLQQVHNTTHLFVPFKMKDESAGSRIIRIPRDFKGFLNAQLSIPSPVYTNSSVKIDYTPLFANISVNGGDITNSIWHTPNIPGSYTITLNVDDIKEDYLVDVLDIALILDSDSDLVVDADEALYGTDPNNPDTDGDGVLDGKDLSPLMNPAEPIWQEKQKIGMVRIVQPIEAWGLDGYAEIWEAYPVFRNYKIIVKKRMIHSYASEGTKKSIINEENVKRIINMGLEESGFEAYKIEHFSSTELNVLERAVSEVEMVADGRFEDSSLFPASFPSKPIGYRFYYNHLRKYYKSYIKNTEELHFPNGDNFFCHLLYPIKIKRHCEQSISIQFRDLQMLSKIYYRDDENYKLPGFVYSFFTSDNFQQDANESYYDGLATLALEDKDIYSAVLELPADKANYASSYLKITPVWIEKKGNDTSFSPLFPSVDVTGITRKVILPEQTDGEERVITQEFLDFSGLNSNILDATIFQTPSQNTQSKIKMSSTCLGIIIINPSDEEKKFNVTQIDKKITTYIDLISGPARKVATLTQTKLKREYKVEKLENLPEDHWARSPKFRGPVAVLETVQGVAAIVTDGQQVIGALREGDSVKAVYYSGKVVLSGVGTTISLAESSVKVFKVFGKGSKVAKFSNKLACTKTAVVLTVAVGVVEVSYNAYEYSNTDDPILKTYYKERIVADSINTGISVISIFSPHTFVFTITWTIGVEIYRAIWGEDFAYKVACDIGSACEFLRKYISAKGIPSQSMNDAYTSAEDALLEKIQIRNENPLRNIEINPELYPYIAIFVDPDL
jgi:hypothetical protein